MGTFKKSYKNPKPAGITFRRNTLKILNTREETINSGKSAAERRASLAKRYAILYPHSFHLSHLSTTYRADYK
jgi:hypothetical protein